jgi:hypothetical protein
MATEPGKQTASPAPDSLFKRKPFPATGAKMAEVQAARNALRR